MEGIDAARVTAWMLDNVGGVTPPLDVELIAGGRSNLTYKVTDAEDRTYALRRPPLSHVLPTAHDMGREFRIISALQNTAVPVPPSLGLCSDVDVNGAAFYVMGFVDGVIVRGADVARTLSPDARRRAGPALVDVLAALHAIDPDDVGLGDLGRKEGYIERQLKRWKTQFDASKQREIPEIDEVHRRLSASVPDQGRASIVHGDYRLDNTILAPDGEVRAVLDWELCTLGDPLADVGLLMVYWTEPGESSALGLEQAPTEVDGFASRAELRDLYASLSGRDLSHLDYYVAFGYWKLACIVEGVYARYRAGAMGGDRSGEVQFAERAPRLGAAALDAAERLQP